MAFNLGGAERPPVGSGSYASWIVFIVIIMLSVALASILLSALGLRKVG